MSNIEPNQAFKVASEEPLTPREAKLLAENMQLRRKTDRLEDELEVSGSLLKDTFVELAKKNIENKELKTQIRTDAMTGIKNRLGLMEALAERSEGSVLLYVDLDEFKKLNDTHGHAMGDKGIIAVANYIQSKIRDTDTVARVGGDEFVVYLRNVDNAQPTLKAIALRMGLSKGVQIENDLFIRGSIGKIEVDMSQDPEDIIKQADQKMYETKQAKRAVKGNVLQRPASALAP